MITWLKIASWEKLPIESILNLCRTNRELSKICNDKLTWTTLLRRDYSIDYRGNQPLEEYTKQVLDDIVMLLYKLTKLPT